MTRIRRKIERKPSQRASGHGRPPARPGRRTTTGLAERLGAGLSTDELPGLLARALAALNEEALDGLVASIGGETANALRTVLTPSVPVRGQADSRAVTPARIKQEWAAAWGRWSDCVSEASLEDGRYLEQDHDWEPPYLDSGSLSSDLDDAAEAMRPWIRRVVADDLDPGFSFADQLIEAAAEVGSGLPEWMDGAAEEFAFGPTGTGSSRAGAHG